jgi:hypothetical protein
MKDIPRGYIVLSSEVNEVRRQRLLSGTKSANTSCRTSRTSAGRVARNRLSHGTTP